MKMVFSTRGLANRILAVSILLPLGIILFSNSYANAQITSDGSLNTNISQDGNRFTITHGSAAGSNLFHSFGQFSVPNGGSATFDLSHTPNVSTIFSRVTGGNISQIDGLIEAINNNNPVSLFLLNPSGIILGENARLNIGGSFVGTTANSIKFVDGTEFSAVNLAEKPLLTMNVPIGLQMGNNPGAITVQNIGHNLKFPITPFSSSPDRSNNPDGFSVNSGNTLAFIGGQITLDGGLLYAPSGHIELGSASNGTVNLDTSSPIWSFNYSNIQQFANIQLLAQSLADASGTPGGSIHFQGRNISLHDGSAALLVNQGTGNAGDIRVNASESLELRGIGSDGFPQSLLRADNFSNGDGGNIVVSASQLFLQDGGSFHGFNFGKGRGSNISVEIRDLLQMAGVSAISGFASSINTNTNSSGNSGDVRVTTNKLQILDGAVIGNSSLGTGLGGDTTINATDYIEISGENPKNLADSVIVVGTFSQANAGKLTINASKLIVRDGGGIVNSTVNRGNAGDLIINVSDSIEVSGVGSISRLPSRIGARAELLAAPIRQLFGLPDTIAGNTGKLTINTSRLQIKDGAIVGVDHQGIGDAGKLEINANSIRLDNGGSLTAATKQGEGGNIFVQTNNLLMRRGSSIVTNAGGVGNGGNITINSPVIVGWENSDIVANAVTGNGGNIQIATQGIFGLKYRPELTSENDITASSQFGVNGTVDINNFGINPNSALIELPANVTDSSQQIASGCAANTGSSFIATGRGGLPNNPTQEMRSDRTWFDIRDISAFRKSGEITGQIPPSQEVIIQATSWHRNSTGKIELVANQSPAVQYPLTCAGIAQK